MSREPNIDAEIRQIAETLANLPVSMPYSVPEGYFQALSGMVQDRVATGLEGVQRYPGAVPDGYFQTLPDQIWARIHQESVKEELESIAPTLNNIGKGMPYSIPASAPSINIAAITGGKDAAPVVAMSTPARNKLARIKYMAAAAVVGVILVGSYFFSNDPVNVTRDSSGLIQQYASLDISNEIDKLEEDDLHEYLGTAEKLHVPVERDMVFMDELPNVEEHIELMSDDELMEYLDDHGIAVAQIESADIK